MKTSMLIVSFSIIVVAVIVSVLYVSQMSHYSLEIHGMKDTYSIGEEYSFYYTLSGYGNTCGGWLVWHPDQNGNTITRGESIDCTQPKNKELSYDSRKDFGVFGSVVPDIVGTYNVTVAVEKLKDPVVFEFEVIDDFEKTWGGPGNRHPAFMGFDIPRVCTEDMIKHLVKYSTMFDGKDVPYEIKLIGLGDNINVQYFDRCVEELLERNPKVLENEN